ncbi:MAG: DUF5671 domain-containing protein [Bryobacterales bacterium]|nr:DUF5671 domain-containing protein [Bryobacterales bacterium]
MTDQHASQSHDSSPLVAFIGATKRQGASDEFLASMLIRRGWNADDVYSALGDYWALLVGVPVPRRRSSAESARDAFFYLLSFVTLAIWATALGAVLFQVTDLLIPDPVSGRGVYNFRSAIAWNLAALGVAFPIYILAMRFIFLEARKAPERLQSPVRKWLTYLALLGTAGAVIGDLILFLGYFLLGELSARFLVKEAIVLAICGGIFAYYLASLKWDRDTDMQIQRTRNRGFAGLALAAVVATFVAGMSLSGTPAEQREREADRRRIGDLQAIARAIHDRHIRKTEGAPALPPSLPALKAERFVDGISDPETGIAYRYRPNTGTGYELCATFAHDNAQERDTWRVATPFWKHGVGERCFVLDASTTPPI